MTEGGDALAAEWQVWLASEILDGTPDAELVTVLAGHGLDPVRARAEIDAVRASPAFVVAARDRRGDRQALLLRALLRAHAAHAPPEVERGSPVDLDRQIRHARADHRPLHFPGAAATWPAVRSWTLDALDRRVGHVEVDACFGRSADPEPDRFFGRHTRRVRFSEVVRAAQGGPSDDVYLIANNTAFPALADALLPDLDPPAIVGRDLPGSTRFWLGPEGTFTRLHCDDVDLVFAQIVGRKRWWLASPAEDVLLHHLLGYYPQFDLRAPPPGVTVRECLLEPGDLLFLPAGWWHQVLALDPSVSTSFVGFADRNHYAGYRPGLPDAG